MAENSSVISDSLQFSTLRAVREGVPVPVPIPTSGVVELRVGQGSSITLGAGTIYGFRYLDANDTQVVLAEELTDIKWLRTTPGTVLTILHEQLVDGDGNPLAAEQRCFTSSGNTVTVGVINTKAFFGFSPALAGFRWAIADEDAFVPGNPLDWVPPVKYKSEALDRLAAAVVALQGGAPIG